MLILIFVKITLKTGDSLGFQSLSNREEVWDHLVVVLRSIEGHISDARLAAFSKCIVLFEPRNKEKDDT